MYFMRNIVDKLFIEKVCAKIIDTLKWFWVKIYAGTKADYLMLV